MFGQQSKNNYGLCTFDGTRKEIMNSKRKKTGSLFKIFELKAHVVSAMNIEYYAVLLILVIIVGIVYYFSRPKSRQPIDLYSAYALNHGGKYPAAFTAGREGDNYLNYYVDSDTGSLRLQSDPYPVTKDGVPYKRKNHGQITYNENGFSIEGISVPFNCPNQFEWDMEKKSCKPKPLCRPSYPNGTIKGIAYYNLEYLEKYPADESRGADEPRKFHERLYAICAGANGNEESSNDFLIGECQNNQVYNQQPENAAGADPCVFYDICSDHLDGFKHREITDINVSIPTNGFYVCNQGKSELKFCNNDEMLSSLAMTCIETGPCFNKKNGVTLPSLENPSNSFIYCRNDRSHTIFCPNGIYTEGDRIRCINDNCDPKFVGYFHNEHASVPVSASYCINNELRTDTIDPEPKEYNITNTIADPNLKRPKLEMFNDVVMLPTKQISFTDDSKGTKAIDVHIDVGAVMVSAQYEYHLPVGVMPANAQPNNNDMKYISLMGHIRKFTEPKGYEYWGMASDHEPFMTLSREPRKFDPSTSPVLEMQSCGWVILSSKAFMAASADAKPKVIFATDKELIQDNMKRYGQFSRTTVQERTELKVIVDMRDIQYFQPFYPVGICESFVDVDRHLWLCQVQRDVFVTYSVPADALSELLSIHFDNKTITYPTPSWANRVAKVHQDCWFLTSVNYNGEHILTKSEIEPNLEVPSFTYMEWLMKYKSIDEIQNNVVPVGKSATPPSFDDVINYPSYTHFVGVFENVHLPHQPKNINRQPLFS